MRLFVAVVPPQSVLEHLDEFLEVRREVGVGLRWASPEQWHLTLAFCAAFPEHRIGELEQRLARAAARRDRFEACLAGGGAFPNVGRARVLWLGLDAPAADAAHMAQGARASIAKSGGQVDGQRFRSHLTLARIARPIEATNWVRLLDAYRGPTWWIDSMELIASYLGEGERGRPRYETIGRYSLGPASRNN